MVCCVLLLSWFFLSSSHEMQGKISTSWIISTYIYAIIPIYSMTSNDPSYLWTNPWCLVLPMIFFHICIVNLSNILLPLLNFMGLLFKSAHFCICLLSLLKLSWAYSNNSYLSFANLQAIKLFPPNFYIGFSLGV